MTRASLADQLTALKASAANDNKPRKQPEPRYRGTLPALRWLYTNHPELAEPVATAVKSLADTNWETDAIDNDQEIRPTVGEIVKAAMDSFDEHGKPIWREPIIDDKNPDDVCVRLGALKFVRGELVEFGRTKKGRKLRSRDKISSRTDEPAKDRDPSLYVFRTRSITPSPLHAEPYQRPFSGEPALAPMYDPQKGVEANRAVLRSFGVDGSVPFELLPFPATRYPAAIAAGAEFLGGVAQSSGNASLGAIEIWDMPEAPKGEARMVIEEVAARGTLQSIGAIVGRDGDPEAGKRALIDAARILVAANDNKRQKKHTAEEIVASCSVCI